MMTARNTAPAILLAEAENVLRETGLTPRQLADKIADIRRYCERQCSFGSVDSALWAQAASKCKVSP